MSTLHGRLFASLSTLLLPLFAMPAEAHRVWPMVGVHPGDATVTMMCRPGSYLSGFNGRAGLWLDAVQIICADAHGPAGPQSDVFGGTGGGPVTASCAADQDRHINAVKIDLTSDGKRIKNLIVYCGAPTSTSLTRHALVANMSEDSHSRDRCMAYHPAEAYVNGMGQYYSQMSSLNPVKAVVQGSETVTNTNKDCSMPPQERDMAQQNCPSETFVGMTIRYGKDVNSVGFICDVDPS